MRRPRHPLPIVGQRAMTLPDGTEDPAGSTDCGEACCSIVLEAFDLAAPSPGCIREAMGLPSSFGDTTAFNLERFLKSYRLDVVTDFWRPSQVSVHAHHLRMSGGLAILLGRWVFPTSEHWMVTAGIGADELWFSDPWTETILSRTWETVSALSAGQVVIVHGR